MTAWTQPELSRIGTADELTIVALGHDGKLRKPVTAPSTTVTARNA